MIMLLDSKITPAQLKKLREIYPDYVKIVVDITKSILAAGCEYHIDCEEVLLRNGSKQEDIFGGGFSIKEKRVDYTAFSNYKPAFGHITYEIADLKVRKKFRENVEKVFGEVKNEKD